MTILLTDRQAIDLEIAVITGQTCDMDLAGVTVRVANVFNPKIGRLSRITAHGDDIIPDAIRDRLRQEGYGVQYSSLNGQLVEVYAPKRKNETYYFRLKFPDGC